MTRWRFTCTAEHWNTSPSLTRTSAPKKAAYRLEKKAEKNAGLIPPERVRYKEHSTVERVFWRLEDDFGGRKIRVREHMKETCHLMFGVLAFTLDQLMHMLL